MRNSVSCLRTGLLVRVAAVALMASGVAACSSDTTRFGEDPFSNPFSSASSAPSQPQEPRYTGTVRAAPTSQIQRAPLGAPSDAQARPMRGFENSGGGYRSSMSEPRSTGSVGTPRMAAGSSNWSAQGGTTVTLGRGETITTLSNRYGVPASAILQANNLQNANGVGPGQQLIIPSYSANRTASAAPVRQAPTAYAPSNPMGAAPVAAPMAEPRVAAVPTPHVGPKTKMNFVPGAQPAGAKAVAPTQKVAAVAAPIAPKPAAAAPSPKLAVAPKAEASDNVKTASLKVDPAPAAAQETGPSFRWPVRGRVISAYGSKTSGASNDGINLAVPEGTDVKASDDGVVAYAGSELKGFGNLVLIRHSNGWVTAYAHNSALEVKRGDSVRRGQIIAKSGSTGNVSTPQLHFEVRQGAKTVDPLQHLPSA